MKKLLLLLMALMMIGGSRAMAEYTEEVWYTEALKESVVSAGNNLRLKNVIERAQKGEQITIGTVGGSITEGALASSYEECWAMRFAARFGETYGTDGGGNVTLVNSGVGGDSFAVRIYALRPGYSRACSGVGSGRVSGPGGDRVCRERLGGTDGLQML